MVFNVNGDAPGRYEIYQYQMANDTTEYKIIGNWTDQLHLEVWVFLNITSNVYGGLSFFIDNKKIFIVVPYLDIKHFISN